MLHKGAGEDERQASVLARRAGHGAAFRLGREGLLSPILVGRDYPHGRGAPGSIWGRRWGGGLGHG